MKKKNHPSSSSSSYLIVKNVPFVRNAFTMFIYRTEKESCAAAFSVHDSDFSIVSLSRFVSIVRARVSVPVYVRLPYVHTMCV